MSQVFTAAAKMHPAPTVASDLQGQFRRSPYWAIRQLICDIDQDYVVLRGTVPCFYLKQVAQSLALKAVGTGNVWSDIEVLPD